jgi:hypothetical protein
MTTEHNKTQYNLKLWRALQSESDFATTPHPQNLHHVQVQLLHVSTVQKNVFLRPKYTIWPFAIYSEHGSGSL